MCFLLNEDTESAKLAVKSHLCHLDSQQFHWVTLGGHLRHLVSCSPFLMHHVALSDKRLLAFGCRH